jgi:hypothetical protein
MLEAASAGSCHGGGVSAGAENRVLAEKRTAVVKVPKAVDREFPFERDPDRFGQDLHPREMTSALSRAEAISRPDTQSVSWPFQIAINIDLRQSTAHLTGLQAPAMLGVQASLDHVATAVVSV